MPLIEIGMTGLAAGWQAVGMQGIGFIGLALAGASAFWTANDPFVGKWKLDVSRSTIVDEMRVQALGENKYSFNFEGSPTETVVADGTDQPAISGTTLSVKSEDPHSLTVVRKQSGQVVVTANWKLSDDGRTLRDAFISAQPNGPNVTVDYLYKRTAGTDGFAGTWESTTKPMGLNLELGIQPYGKEGLTLTSPGTHKDLTFDGQEHAIPGATAGLTMSGRRRGARVIEYTDKTGGEIAHIRRFELSPDGRTLTQTVHTAGRATPDVLVFERE